MLALVHIAKSDGHLLTRALITWVVYRCLQALWYVAKSSYYALRVAQLDRRIEKGLRELTDDPDSAELVKAIREARQRRARS